MSGGAPPTDFSTSFWKEFRLRYPRPAVYIPVGLAYLALFPLMLLATGEPELAHFLLLAPAGLVFSLVPAVAASRRFSSRKERLELRERLEGLGPAERYRAHRGWCLRQLARGLVAPALAVGLMLPFYLAIGLVLSEATAAYWRGALLGLALWLGVAAMACLAATVGAASGLAGGAAHSGLRAFGAALVLVCARFLAALLVNAIASGFLDSGYGLRGPWLDSDGRLRDPWPDPARIEFITWLVLTAADFAVCLLGARLFLRRLPGLLARRLLRPESAYASDAEVLADSPEGLGLGVSFWALFRWKFWRDPFCRAEKRNLWSRRRLAVMWTAVLGGALGVTLLGMAGRVVFFWMPRLAVLAAGVISSLPVWIAPAVMLVGIISERRNGALESMLLTPAAPLRLAAAKLVGRCGSLVRVGLVLALLQTAFCCLSSSLGGSYLGMPDAMLLLWGLLWAVEMPLLILAFGAVGLYFGTRFRSLLAALVLSYAATAGLVAAGWYMVAYAGAYAYSDLFVAGLVPHFTCVLIVGLALRIFLPGAARRLALGRDE